MHVVQKSIFTNPKGETFKYFMCSCIVSIILCYVLNTTFYFVEDILPKFTTVNWHFSFNYHLWLSSKWEISTDNTNRNMLCWWKGFHTEDRGGVTLSIGGYFVWRLFVGRYFVSFLICWRKFDISWNSISFGVISIVIWSGIYI